MSTVHVQVCIFYLIKVLCTSDSAAKSHHKREKNAIEIICGFLSIFIRFIGRWPPSGPGPDSRGPRKDSLCQLASCSCHALRSKRLGHRRGKPRSLEPLHALRHQKFSYLLPPDLLHDPMVDLLRYHWGPDNHHTAPPTLQAKLPNQVINP